LTFVVLIILAVVWALYLASWFHSRTRGRRRSSNSIASFNKHLSVLERTRPYEAPVPGRPLRAVPTPAARAAAVGAASTVTALAASRPGQAPSRRRAAVRSSGAPRTVADAQRRRREVLAVLAGLNLIALAAAMALGGIGFVALGITATLVVVYLFLLAQAQQLAIERREKVHYLHDDDRYDDVVDLRDAALLSQSAT
jgi:hypothetical protein